MYYQEVLKKRLWTMTWLYDYDFLLGTRCKIAIYLSQACSSFMVWNYGNSPSLSCLFQRM
jgi:hypothetical protein